MLRALKKYQKWPTLFPKTETGYEIDTEETEMEMQKNLWKNHHIRKNNFEFANKRALYHLSIFIKQK